VRERKGAYRILVGKVERAHLEDLDIDGRIVLKSMFEKWVWA
jgi:hypothetical protein